MRPLRSRNRRDKTSDVTTKTEGMWADEHPEHRIDRVRRGELAPEEKAALDRRLASCSVCAGQVSLAQRFERELSSRPRDPLLDQRAVEGAMQRMRDLDRAGPVARARSLKLKHLLVLTE
jgi:anti-sigma factor RsiW